MPMMPFSIREQVPLIWKKKDFDDWAICDGFKNRIEATHFFETHYGKGWDYMDFDIIKFSGHWLPPEPVDVGYVHA